MSIIDHEKRKHGGGCCGTHKHAPSKLNVKFKKLHEDAVLPQYAKYGDAGMDCYSVSEPEFKDTYVGYKLGFAVEIPYGYVGLLFPRSSNSKKDLILSNSVGVIDSGYRGEVEARFRDVNFDTIYKNFDGMEYMSEDTKIYSKGDAVCQLMILPYPKVEAMWAFELSDTIRGTSGFGSTGK